MNDQPEGSSTGWVKSQKRKAGGGWGNDQPEGVHGLCKIPEKPESEARLGKRPTRRGALELVETPDVESRRGLGQRPTRKSSGLVKPLKNRKAGEGLGKLATRRGLRGG